MKVWAYISYDYDWVDDFLFGHDDLDYDAYLKWTTDPERLYGIDAIGKPGVYLFRFTQCRDIEDDDWYTFLETDSVQKIGEYLPQESL